jgi:DNA-binding response OmpR family regulator
MSDKKQILLIDDDAQLADTIAILLENVGYAVSRAQDVAQGSALARETRPNLVVIDLSLAGAAEPAGSGGVQQLYESAQLAGVPLLALSGARGAPVDLWIDETSAPVQAVLHKPFRPHELLAQVEQLLALGDSARREGPATLLVVDDDPDFVAILTRILKARGYRVLTAANGGEALAVMHRQKPDLVLLDIMMSTILDGLSVSERMAADSELGDVPVFMISSIADTEYAAAFPTDRAMHIEAWISKPIDPEDLLQKIERQLK